jgi:hypothetical protein
MPTLISRDTHVQHYSQGVAASHNDVLFNTRVVQHATLGTHEYGPNKIASLGLGAPSRSIVHFATIVC